MPRKKNTPHLAKYHLLHTLVHKIKILAHITDLLYDITRLVKLILTSNFKDLENSVSWYHSSLAAIQKFFYSFI